MDSKDIRVLKKLLQHTDAIMRYCQNCKQLADFEADSMRTVSEDIPQLNRELAKILGTL